MKMMHQSDCWRHFRQLLLLILTMFTHLELYEVEHEFYHTILNLPFFENTVQQYGESVALWYALVPSECGNAQCVIQPTLSIAVL